MPTASEGAVESIEFLTEDKAVVLATGRTFSRRSSIWRTSDRGVTWEKVATIGPVFAMDFFGETAGVGVGELGTIQWTTDGGETWVDHDSPVIGNFYGVSMIDERTAIAVGDGVIIRNANGATTARSDLELPTELPQRSLYPNPAATSVTLTVDVSEAPYGPFTLVIHDVIGRELDRQTILPASGRQLSVTWPVDMLSPGVYFYSVESRLPSMRGRFVVSR
jgi:hypothetical protein